MGAIFSLLARWFCKSKQRNGDKESGGDCADNPAKARRGNTASTTPLVQEQHHSHRQESGENNCKTSCNSMHESGPSVASLQPPCLPLLQRHPSVTNGNNGSSTTTSLTMMMANATGGNAADAISAHEKHTASSSTSAAAPLVTDSGAVGNGNGDDNAAAITAAAADSGNTPPGKGNSVSSLLLSEGNSNTSLANDPFKSNESIPNFPSEKTKSTATQEHMAPFTSPSSLSLTSTSSLHATITPPHVAPTHTNNSSTTTSAAPAPLSTISSTTTSNGSGTRQIVVIRPTSMIIPPNSMEREFVWKHGGSKVIITGTFDNWTGSVVMNKDMNSPSVFRAAIKLDPSIAEHQFKFIVDGVWRCSLDFATVHDSCGNVNNVIRIDDPSAQQQHSRSSVSSSRSRNGQLRSSIRDQ